MQMTLFEDQTATERRARSRITEPADGERQQLIRERQLLESKLSVLQLKQEIALYHSMGIDVPPHYQQVSRPERAQVIESSSTELGQLVDWREWRSEIDRGHNYPFLVYRSKEDGKLEPYFRTERDFHEARMISRYLFDTNEHCKVAFERLTDYVIGKGISVEISPKDSADKDLADAVLEFLDDWLEENNWTGDREREFFIRSRRDGEVATKLSHVGEGRSTLRFVEPEIITEPYLDDDALRWLQVEYPYAADWSEHQSWSFGVHTPAGDIARHQGYFLQYSSNVTDWDYVPIDRMSLVKSNVDEDVKRGIPDAFPVQTNLLKASRLLSAILTGATTQAKIAYIKEMEQGVSETGARTLASTDVDFQRQVTTTGGGQKTFQAKILPDGTALTVPQGRKYHPGPMGTPQGPLYVQVLAAGLRAISVRWGFPEFIFSGDASTNAFASSAAAGSAFDVAKQGAQTRIASEEAGIFWKVIKIGYKAGVFRKFENRFDSFQQLKRRLSMTVVPTEIDTTDKQVETDRNEKMHNAGIMSKATWASKEGLDYEKEKEQGAAPAADPGFGGAGQPTDDSESDELAESAAEIDTPVGELGERNRLTWTRNLRAIKEVVDEFKAGDTSRVLAEELLVSIGLRPERAKRIMDEAENGRTPTTSTETVESAGSIGPMLHSNYSPDASTKRGSRRLGRRQEDVFEAARLERTTNEKIDQAIAATDPIEGQKGRVNIQGLVIAIENPLGTYRHGIGADGNEWRRLMAHHYGEIIGTDGADHDPIDVFIGPDPESELVFVIDQQDADGRFDEHKVMLGWGSRKSAVQSYLTHYPDGWNLGPVTAVTMDEFKRWIRSRDNSQPFALAKEIENLDTSKVLEQVLERAWAKYP